MVAQTDIYPDLARMSQAAARQFASLAASAIVQHGRFSVALSGGNTPKALYALLAEAPLRDQIPWPQVDLFWGDERYVPLDDPQSNFRMVREALIDHIAIPPQNVHPILQAENPTAAADNYERQMRQFFTAGGLSEDNLPRFDLILLGLGDDGHTASLFPGTTAVDQRTGWVVPNWVEKFNMWRITLTVPVLNAGSEVWFLVAGADKRDRVAEVLQGPRRPRELPSQLILPASGRLRWFLDQAAADALRKVS